MLKNLESIFVKFDTAVVIAPVLGVVLDARGDIRPHKEPLVVGQLIIGQMKS